MPSHDQHQLSQGDRCNSREKFPVSDNSPGDSPQIISYLVQIFFICARLTPVSLAAIYILLKLDLHRKCVWHLRAKHQRVLKELTEKSLKWPLGNENCFYVWPLQRGLKGD
jgi:hypothetical protein